MRPLPGYALLLSVPARIALASRYDYFRRERNASETVALIYVLSYLLACCIFRFESPAWQAILSPRGSAFAHLSRQPLRPADPLRYAVQALWVACAIQDRPASPPWINRAIVSTWQRAWRAVVHADMRYLSFLQHIPGRVSRHFKVSEQLESAPRLSPARRAMIIAATIVAAPLALLCITQPLNWTALSIFIFLLWCIAMVLRRMPGRLPGLMMVALSIIVSCRYLWWRYTSTLHWDDMLDASFGIALVLAETHSWAILMLGYLQTMWPLKRKPTMLPGDSRTWPTVDLFIPTYNEDISVVMPTVYAAQRIDWPQDKLNVYILDDGKREEFRRFAADAGVGYIVRPDNRHAKAGNLNHALTKTKGELLALFDCDHIPSRSFLQLTVGGFLRNEQLALVQTPHHFFSADPFERNLDSFRVLPNENTLFYGLIQDGNDTWDAAFFCGSCAVLRRSAIEAIGGFAVETVTEDAHTALRLHRSGYTSSYLRIPQAAGLATESLSAHIGQRMRWARGMVQIFRTDNPLLGRGLSFFQRLCYLNSTMHFLSGLPRLVYLLAPLGFLLLHAYIIYAPAMAIALYVLPHVVLANITNSHLQGKYRHTFWSEVYETVLAWYIAWPTTVALFWPSKGRFNVTAKGGLVDQPHFDWTISRPYMILALLNFMGLGFGIWRWFNGPAHEHLTVILTMIWVTYNIIIIGVAVAVAAETRQVRQRHRVEADFPARIGLSDGRFYPGVLRDYSDNSVGIELTHGDLVAVHDPVTLILRQGPCDFVFSGNVQRSAGNTIGIRLDPMDAEQARDYMRCTFARAHSWLDSSDKFPFDRPLHSIYRLIGLSLRGYGRMVRHAPWPLQVPLRAARSVVNWLLSFVPRSVTPSTSSFFQRPYET